MTIGIYLRLSMADGDLEEANKKESNSIENQRLLLQDYILKNPDLYGDVIEYVDDGYTGTNFNRPAFKQMIVDAQNGLIQVVIAKDLSRLGRNYIEMGDYLDQIFPRLGVRVIAVGSGYDSNNHVGDVSGLDTAITNFINTMYSRDLSVRYKTSYRARLKNGICTNGMVPYGYYRISESKREWFVDKEAAEIVKMIFEKAASGWRALEIVDLLNRQKIQPPGKRKAEVYNIPKDHTVKEEEYLWDYHMVRRIIMDYVYTGTLVGHRTEVATYEFNKVRRVPKEEWIAIPNHHEALVDEKTYEKAQFAIRRRPFTDRRKPAIYSLKTKLRCGNCHLAFRYREDEKRFYCRHRGDAGTYSKCTQKLFSYPRVEKSIFRALKQYLSGIKCLEAVTKKSIEQIAPSYEKKRKDNTGKIDVLKAERVRQYEGFAAGVITKEAYLKKKEELTAEIEILEKETAELNEQEKSDNLLLKEVSKCNRKAEHALEAPELTRSIAETFIKNVYMYDYDRIEIIYKTEDMVERVIQRNNEIEDALRIENGAKEVSHHYNSKYVKLLRERNNMKKGE